MVRNTRERHPLPLAHGPRGQRNLELASYRLCVLIERFVKVAEAEEEQGVGIAALDVQVLTSERGCHAAGCTSKRLWSDGFDAYYSPARPGREAYRVTALLGRNCPLRALRKRERARRCGSPGPRSPKRGYLQYLDERRVRSIPDF